MEEKESREGKGIWTVTRETAEIEAKQREEEAARRELEEGLAKCPVCGSKAKVVEFGLEGNGVWVGCDRTEECVRYIEIQTEGWSVFEVAGEWNRNNSGVYLLIREIKRWFRLHFGAEKWRKKRKNREIEEGNRKKEAKRREIFGLKQVKREGFWHRVLARRQKVGREASAEEKK